MRVRATSWLSAGRTLLIAAWGHGWLILIGALCMIALTYVTAILLVNLLKKGRDHEITIKTPFLLIRSKPWPQAEEPKPSIENQEIRVINCDGQA